MPWNVRSFRLTVFPGPTVEPGHTLHWRELFGDEPDTQITRGGQHHQEGPFRRGRLALVTHLPLRIDLHYAPTPVPPDEIGDTIPNLGAIEDSLDEFIEVARSLVERRTPTARLAFGAVLDEPVANHDEAYVALNECIRSTRFDLEGAREFTYQVNRPRMSRSLSGLLLNRVAKWSATKMQMLAIEPATGRVTPGRQVYAATLELDVSTQADYQGGLPVGVGAEILAEMIALGGEIATEGDIR